PGFPWAPLTFEWWQRAGQRCGASTAQLRFAAFWAATGNGAAAARFAGLGGDHPKQAGSMALRRVAVGKLLRAAVAEMHARRIPLSSRLRTEAWRYEEFEPPDYIHT